MLPISRRVSIPDKEIEISRIRAQGPGGQNVNKVSSGVHLRFDVGASSLPDYYKERILKLRDRHITSAGVIVIKTQRNRSPERNKEQALRLLQEMIRNSARSRKERKPTKPSSGSQQKRLDQKKKRSRTKALRRRVIDE